MAAGAPERCRPARPVSVLMVHGTDDRYVPWSGGRTRGGGAVASVGTTLDTWLARDDCPAAEALVLAHGDARCVTHGPCAAATTVGLCTVSGGGHTWPGGSRQLPGVLVGPTSRDFDASTFIWQFFARHPMQGP
jgi:polyhydroxybutyrate depolymerase